MSRRLGIASCIALVLALGCGGPGAGQTTTAGVTDPGAGPGVDPPELPAPTASPEPTPTPTPVTVALQCDTESALYLSPPPDGVLRPPSELACVSQGACPEIVLIACSGPNVRVGDDETGENLCHSLPASSVVLADFTVATKGTFDPATGITKTSGTATIATGDSYEYSVTVHYAPETGVLTGTGDVFGWSLVIEGRCH